MVAAAEDAGDQGLLGAAVAGEGGRDVPLGIDPAMGQVGQTVVAVTDSRSIRR